MDASAAVSGGGGVGGDGKVVKEGKEGRGGGGGNVPLKPAPVLMGVRRGFGSVLFYISIVFLVAPLSWIGGSHS